jgi:phosphate transport system ATP-binding protein
MTTENVIDVQNVSIWYGENKAVNDVSLSIEQAKVFALIGPSGCGKSTLLKSINRMNDFVDGFKLEGSIGYKGMNIYDKQVDPVVVRKCIGMVFQKPNPFPSSIFENIAWAPRINGYKGDIHELVERSLTKAGLWKEVKDRLKSSGFSLSGGQQQRLCIARTVAMQPDVILMDEPCSALDPISTSIIEELIIELKKHYSIVIVTHSMQQAARVSDSTAFLYRGDLVEKGETSKIFSMPDQKLTKEYISGKFG